MYPYLRNLYLRIYTFGFVYVRIYSCIYFIYTFIRTKVIYDILCTNEGNIQVIIINKVVKYEGNNI